MDTLPQVDLVLFDLDGTLVNSEKLHFQAYSEAIRGLGNSADISFLTRDQYCFAKHSADGQDSFFSTHRHRTRREAAEAPDMDQTTVSVVEQIKANKTQIFAALLEGAVQTGELTLMPGAKAFLAFLRAARIPTCIVTHSRRPTFEMMAHAGLRPGIRSQSVCGSCVGNDWDCESCRPSLCNRRLPHDASWASQVRGAFWVSTFATQAFALLPSSPRVLFRYFCQNLPREDEWGLTICVQGETKHFQPWTYTNDTRTKMLEMPSQAVMGQLDSSRLDAYLRQTPM